MLSTLPPVFTKRKWENIRKATDNESMLAIQNANHDINSSLTWIMVYILISIILAYFLTFVMADPFISLFIWIVPTGPAFGLSAMCLSYFDIVGALFYSLRFSWNYYRSNQNKNWLNFYQNIYSSNLRLDEIQSFIMVIMGFCGICFFGLISLPLFIPIFPNPISIGFIFQNLHATWYAWKIENEIRAVKSSINDPTDRTPREGFLGIKSIWKIIISRAILASYMWISFGNIPNLLNKLLPFMSMNTSWTVLGFFLICLCECIEIKLDNFIENKIIPRVQESEDDLNVFNLTDEELMIAGPMQSDEFRQRRGVQGEMRDERTGETLLTVSADPPAPRPMLNALLSS